MDVYRSDSSKQAKATVARSVSFLGNMKVPLGRDRLVEWQSQNSGGMALLVDPLDQRVELTQGRGLPNCRGDRWIKDWMQV